MFVSFIRAEDFAIYPPLRRKYRGHRPVDDYGATSRRTFQLREHVSLSARPPCAPARFTVSSRKLQLQSIKRLLSRRISPVTRETISRKCRLRTLSRMESLILIPRNRSASRRNRSRNHRGALFLSGGSN